MEVLSYLEYPALNSRIDCSILPERMRFSIGILTEYRGTAVMPSFDKFKQEMLLFIREAIKEPFIQYQ